MTVTLRHDEPEPDSTWDADPAPRLPAPEPATRRGLLRRRTPIERAADLERQRDAARKVMAVQDDPALVKALSAGELAAERQLAEQERAADRDQRRRSNRAAVPRRLETGVRPTVRPTSRPMTGCGTGGRCRAAGGGRCRRTPDWRSWPG